MVEGTAAKAIRKGLDHWLSPGQDWSQHFKRYKEAKSFPGMRQEAGGRPPKQGKDTRPVSPVGESISTVPLDDEENKPARRIDDFNKLTASTDHYSESMFFPESVDSDGYPLGAVFDTDDVVYESDQEEWNLGARRGIARVDRVLSEPQSRAKNIRYRWLYRYRVTPEVIKIAKSCGVFENKKPTGVQLRTFEENLRKARAKGWRNT